MKKAFLELHLSVLLAGWTGIFGKLISLSPGLIVFWRIVIAGALLWGWLAFRKRMEFVPTKDRIGIALVGALLMLQWTLFYASIKASIGFFTAIIEPILTRSRISLKEIAFSVVTLVGISFIFHFDTQYRLGIILGIISAAAAAALAVFFRKYKAKYRADTVMSWQLAGGFAACLILLPFYRHFGPAENFLPSGIDWLYLSIFATFCTLGMYLLQIQALEKISAFTVNLTYNLEPVYSIILAMIIFQEGRDLGPSFYFGLFCIGLSVLLQTMSVVRLQKKVARLESDRTALGASEAERPREMKL